LVGWSGGAINTTSLGANPAVSAHAWIALAASVEPWACVVLISIRVFSISRANCWSAPGGSGAAAQTPAMWSEPMPMAASKVCNGFIMVQEA